MSIQSVLPSWRFIHSDQMKIESRRFFMRVESMPLYETPERMAKLAASFAKDLPTDYPMIHKADQKCGGVITEAILHLGRTNYDTRQPGYFYLLGQAFDSLPVKNIEDCIRNNMRRFIDYAPPKKTQAKAG
ncbi:hypothetical protein HJA87_31135 [Rhizobium bangladeshense]|uniref:Uncharacterized protein n=1 Tax=Rhizobium bangladeshense TaxID=1138189 RepID=A0ABS7LS28_9HYPH|nr:hypothetical protein [Rhizobium bangladeshense]MBY3594257.1 hypothetical protein [Rhizobium bangladeshense]